MYKDLLDIMTVVFGILAVFSLAPISVFLLYLAEESIKQFAFSAVELFEKSIGGNDYDYSN